MQLAELRQLADAIRAEISKAVVGQADSVTLMLTAVFAGGHILLEGPPGARRIIANVATYALVGLLVEAVRRRIAPIGN